jgi:tetratricopeptide (TPR) repeat protein
VIGPHEESDSFAGGHEELYFVASGRAAFTIGGDAVDAPSGTLVYVGDPAVQRGAGAREDGTTVLAFGGRPGEAFEVAAWEFLVPAAAAGREGDWAGAIEHTRRGLEHHPESAELLYHRACYESLGGLLDEARDHLEAAIQRDPRIRERAARDPDLEPLRA